MVPFLMLGAAVMAVIAAWLLFNKQKKMQKEFELYLSEKQKEILIQSNYIKADKNVISRTAAEIETALSWMNNAVAALSRENNDNIEISSTQDVPLIELSREEKRKKAVDLISKGIPIDEISQNLLMGKGELQLIANIIHKKGTI